MSGFVWSRTILELLTFTLKEKVTGSMKMRPRDLEVVFGVLGQEMENELLGKDSAFHICEKWV